MTEIHFKLLCQTESFAAKTTTDPPLQHQVTTTRRYRLTRNPLRVVATEPGHNPRDIVRGAHSSLRDRLVCKDAGIANQYINLVTNRFPSR
jgi:hypothetical protein